MGIYYPLFSIKNTKINKLFFVFLIPMGIYNMLCFHAYVDFIVEICLYNESSLIKYDKLLSGLF